jgi:hypothetical protein
VCHRSKGPNGVPEYVGAIGTESGGGYGSGGSVSVGGAAESGGSGTVSGDVGTESGDVGTESLGSRESATPPALFGPAGRSEPQETTDAKRVNQANADAWLVQRERLKESGINRLCQAVTLRVCGARALVGDESAVEPRGMAVMQGTMEWPPGWCHLVFGARAGGTVPSPGNLVKRRSTSRCSKTRYGPWLWPVDVGRPGLDSTIGEEVAAA